MKKDFDANEYNKQYSKDNYKQIMFVVRKDDPLFDWINSQPKKGEYIKNLIRKDYESNLRKKEKR